MIEPMVRRILASDTSTVTIDVRIVDQLLQFADGLARDDDARHAFGARRRFEVGAGQTVAVGGNGTQLQLALAFDRVDIDAVEIVAGLFRRDRELGAIDQHLQVRRLDAEGVA